MQTRWREAREALTSLQTHMGLGAARTRLPFLIDGLLQPRTVAEQITLLDNATRRVREVERFVASYYPKVRALVEDEVGPLSERGAADPLPDYDAWLASCRRVAVCLTSWRADVTRGPSMSMEDVQRLMQAVLEPLDTSADAKTFSALVLSTPSDLVAAINAASTEIDPAECVVVGPGETASVFFPELALRDFLVHLVENASKHRRSEGAPPEAMFELLPSETDLLHRRVRLGCRGTATDQPVNPAGGLSDQQWGGAINAFGGTIAAGATSADESYVLYIDFQRP